jgi:hypothetical protein
VFLIFSLKNKSGNKSLTMHLFFPLGIKCRGTYRTRNGRFEHPSSFRVETYGDLKTSGYTYGVVSYGGVTYGDVTYRDVSY